MHNKTLIKNLLAKNIELKACRDGFGQGLLEAAKNNGKVVALTADLGESTRINWFAEKYPKEAQPLLKKLKGKYNKTETSVRYGLREGEELSDELYVDKLKTFLEIEDHEATILYHGLLKPLMTRKEEEKGLVKAIIK